MSSRKGILLFDLFHLRRFRADPRAVRISYLQVFFYARTPTLTLQAVGGKACPNGYKGEREAITEGRITRAVAQR